MTEVPTSRRFEDKKGQRVNVVPYRPEHLDALVEMYQKYTTDLRSHGLPPIMRADLEEWLQSLEEEGRAFIAFIGDTVVGHAAYAPVTAEWPDFVVFIAPNYQDRGIGTALLRHVVRNTAAEGFKGVVSHVDRDNDSAIHVYEKCGFEEVDRQPLTVEMKLDFSDDSFDISDDIGE